MVKKAHLVYLTRVVSYIHDMTACSILFYFRHQTIIKHSKKYKSVKQFCKYASKKKKMFLPFEQKENLDLLEPIQSVDRALPSHNIQYSIPLR